MARCLYRYVIILTIIGLLIINAGCAGLSGKTPSAIADSAMPAITASASPTSIDAGKFTTLQWSSANAISISIDPAPVSDDGLPASWPLTGSVNISPKTTTTYTFTAISRSGTASSAVTVTVRQVLPTVSLWAVPSSILAGGSARLTWAAEHATTVSMDNGIGALQGTSGSITVSPANTTTYTATATGPGGNSSASATVTVTFPGELAISLSSNPLSIAAGQSALLSWTSYNAASVLIDQGIGAVAPSGTARVSPASTTTYTATVRDAQGNSKTASVTVTVVEGGTLAVIKHIIVLVQENRSFDHYFGRLGAYRVGKGLPEEIDAADPDTALPDPQGHPVRRYHLRTVCHENLTPDWNESHLAVNGGRMDGFMKAAFLPSTIDPQYHRAMGYFDQTDLPYYYELATQFATSDRFFASVQGGTIPNRMYLMAATSAGHIVYPDYPPVSSEASKTIFDALDDANIDWRYYFQDNSIWLAFYETWNKPTTQGRMRPIEALFTTLNSPNADNELPPVVFIEHGAQIGTDEHPGGPPPGIQKGAALTKKILDALMASSAWPSSVFILSHDEHGGFYDHVPPFATIAPDDIPPRYQKSTDIHADFQQSGLRIPLLVVSPWVKPHFVSHTPREFTSILKFIETRFALAPLTRRDAAADDLTEFFEFSTPHWLSPPPLPDQPTDGACDWQLERSPE